VVDRPFIFQPEFARHELNLQSAIKYVNTKNRPLSVNTKNRPLSGDPH
jgi:hypothetical protein